MNEVRNGVCAFPEEETKINGTMDILKLIMSILIVGIHTEPFGFNIWLDRGYGIITRLCVPFFFVSSAYFYWSREKGTRAFLKRLFMLYIVWSVIYLPFDFESLSKMRLGQVLYRYLWAGNEHALWYLCAAAIGFAITQLMLRFCKPRTVLIISCLFLLIGCIKSTWSPLTEQVFRIRITDFLGSRNGLFYAFPYTALGMYLAKNQRREKSNTFLLLFGFTISLAMLAIESLLFVVIYKTNTTVMWISVLPLTYFFFRIIKNIDIEIDKGVSLYLRRLSTIIYLSQFLFIYLWDRYTYGFTLFLAVSLSAIIFGMMLMKLAENNKMKFLKILY